MLFFGFTKSAPFQCIYVSACPGGPSYAAADGEYVPGNPKESLSSRPVGEVGSKPRSDDSLSGKTPEFDSYWRVEEREAKKRAGQRLGKGTRA